jgi:putative transposase
MTKVTNGVVGGNGRFHLVAQPFLEDPGLPFARVLSAEAIEGAFAAHEGLFGCNADEVFSTPIVLWAFLAQVLRDGKGAACAAAVADIAVYQQQTGGPVPCGDTGDYCRARAKLSLPALRELAGQVAEGLEQEADPSWLWHGLHAKLIDGFTFTMADTEKNQREYPQLGTQKPGVGLPIARACGVLSLSTAAIHDLAIGPYPGKETGESALLRTILESLKGGDVAVFDRYYCSCMMIALLQLQGVQVCTRLHQLRKCDFRRGQRLGKDDHLVTWARPARPEWMAPEVYERIPLTLTLRELRFQVVVPGSRTETITVVTTLTDPEAYPAEDIAGLYGYRWNAELDIRAIKQTLNLDHIPCKSPEMVQLHLWVTLLAYNLVRRLIAVAAALHDRQPRQLGFTLACQAILACWMLLSTGQCRDVRQGWAGLLRRIAANEVANRPGRIEPRVIKRRQQGYPWMTRPRRELRAQCLGR